MNRPTASPPQEHNGAGRPSVFYPRPPLYILHPLLHYIPKGRDATAWPAPALSGANSQSRRTMPMLKLQTALLTAGAVPSAPLLANNRDAV